MLVKHKMVALQRGIEVSPDLGLREALVLMNRVDVTGLLVERGGAVSHFDIAMYALRRLFEEADAPEARTVGELARDVPPVEAEDPIEVAIDRLLRGERVLPVSEGGRRVGLITWSQVDQFVYEILGYGEPGYVRIHTDVFDAPGVLRRVVQAVADVGANIGSIYVSGPRVANLRHLVLRIDEAHAEAAQDALRRSGYVLRP